VGLEFTDAIGIRFFETGIAPEIPIWHPGGRGNPYQYTNPRFGMFTAVSKKLCFFFVF
jgi:hypothetical protein